MGSGFTTWIVSNKRIAYFLQAAFHRMAVNVTGETGYHLPGRLFLITALPSPIFSEV